MKQLLRIASLLFSVLLVDTTDPLPVTVQPWDEPAITRFPPERSWSITNTFSF